MRCTDQPSAYAPAWLVNADTAGKQTITETQRPNQNEAPFRTPPHDTMARSVRSTGPCVSN